MARKRVLITGAAGYLSRQLLPVFRERYDLVLLDRRKPHDIDDIIVRLAFFSPHMAGAGNNPQIFRTTMLRQQIQVTDRMLVVFFAVDTEERRTRLIDQSLCHQ